MAATVMGCAASVLDHKNSSSSSSSLEAKPPPHTLFVWDFDFTVINSNSDEYIPAQFLTKEQLKTGFRELYQSKNGDWHACVEEMVYRALQSEKGSQPALLQAAAQMPYLIPVKQAIDNIYNTPRASQMILSDGNTLFIGEFLRHNEMVSHFDAGVVSNLGSWNEETGRLRVVHQSQQYGGHDCDRCSDNLCKTQALSETLKEKAIVKKKKRRPRIVYVGDGGNDACPVLKVLQKGDIMLARVGQRRACANERQGGETDQEATNDCPGEGGGFGIIPALVKAKEEKGLVPKCEVWEWQTGEELRALVDKILQDVQ